MKSAYRRLAPVFLFALVWCLLLAPSALAATTWTGHLPAKNAVVAAPPVALSVIGGVDGPYNRSTTQISVDGVSRAPIAVPRGASIQLIASYPPSVAQDGTHTASVSIKDKFGVLQSETWQFKTAVPPTLGTPAPASGSLVATTNPTIWLPVSDNTLVASWVVTLNGQPAAATLAAGKLTVLPAVALEDDSLQTVSVTVYDGVGTTATKTWSFYIQVNPEMAEIYCSDCHTDKDFPEHTYNTDCLDCHYASPHTGTPSAYHSTSEVAACRPCHVSSVTVEHQKYGLICESCHLSSTPAVQAAIDNNTTECAACHPGAGSHNAFHATTVSGTCAGPGCHVGTSLTGIHINEATSLSCASCHSSSDPAVIAAIETGDRDCTACHAADAHVTVHETTVSTGCAESECHTGTNLTGIHANPGCAGCHDSTDPAVVSAIDAGDKSCEACHGSDAHVTVHETTTPVSCSGTGCHSGTNLTTVHSASGCAGCHSSTDPTVVNAIATGDRTCVGCHSADKHQDLHTATVSTGCDGTGCHSGTNLTGIHAASGCEGCHSSTDPDVTTAITAGDKTCEACHNEDGVDYHAGAAAAHLSPTTAGCFGAGCHDVSQSLPAVHVLYAGPGTVNPGYATACELCHANPGVDVSTATAACTTACHGATVHSGYHDGHAVTTASAICTSCHGEDLVVTHNVALPDASRCAVCHGDPGNFSKTADCSSCHAMVDHTVQHEITPEPSCSECHAGTNLTTVHTVPGCGGCHDSVDPAVVTAIAAGDKSCAQCHGAQPHGDIGATHSATVGSGSVVVFSNHVAGGAGLVTRTVQCSMCHPSSIVTIHGGGCDACHAGGDPAASVGEWNRTCQDGDCHPTITHDGSGPHLNVLLYGGMCESCHWDEDDWSNVPTEACESCHS